VPWHWREIVDVREWRVKAKHELEYDSEIDKRIGDEIKNNVMPFEKVRERCGEWHDHWALNALQ
jgi:hypothetical protein